VPGLNLCFLVGVMGVMRGGVLVEVVLLLLTDFLLGMGVVLDDDDEDEEDEEDEERDCLAEGRDGEGSERLE